MTRSTQQSFLRKITHIEAIVRLIKDDFLRDRLMPELNTVDLVKSGLDSLRDFGCNQSKGFMNTTRTVN